MSAEDVLRDMLAEIKEIKKIMASGIAAQVQHAQSFGGPEFLQSIKDAAAKAADDMKNLRPPKKTD